jgi:hypothetical protein
MMKLFDIHKEVIHQCEILGYIEFEDIYANALG